MSDRTQEVLYNLTGQVLELYPPESYLGIPSAAGAVVWAGGESLDDDSEFTPTVSVDATSLTISAAAVAGQKRLTFTNTSGATIGRSLLLTNAAGQTEIAVPAAVSSNAYVDFEDDLSYAYAASDTVKGVRLSFTIDSTWVADDDNILLPEDVPYKVIWTYTVAGVARRHYTYFRLVRQFAGHGVTYRDIQRYLPEVLLDTVASQRGLQCRTMIDRAWSEVRADLLNEKIEPAHVRDSELLDLLVTLRTVSDYASVGVCPQGRDPELYAKWAEDEYGRRFIKTVTKLTMPIDLGTAGAADNTGNGQPWFQ